MRPLSRVVFNSSSSNPWLVLPLDVLACVGALVAAARGSFAGAALGAAAGLLLWTLLEYAGHRWLMHRTGTRWQRWIWVHLHKEHHQQQELADPAHRCTSALATIPSMGVVFLACSPWPMALGAAAGVGLGFTLYEALHFAQHHPRISLAASRWRWFRRRLALHASHHSRTLERNFGFLCSTWDRLFGTHQPPEQVDPAPAQRS